VLGLGMLSLLWLDGAVLITNAMIDIINGDHH
jgi:hypothetical protein